MNRVIAVAVVAVALASCRREERDLRAEPPARVVGSVPPSAFQPAGLPPPPAGANRDDESAWAMSEGQRLFDWYACSGCHAHGGGGMGPALMDDEWLYGSDPESIFASIAEGRPNGMPAWGGRVPEYQLWQLVAYVRALGGLVPSTAAPGRSDTLAATPAPQSAEPAAPKLVVEAPR